MARAFILIMLVLSSVPLPAAGGRLVLKLETSDPLTNDAISGACPLEQTPEMLLQRATSQSPASNRMCCSPGKALFRCSTVEIKVGDNVRWLDSDDEIPPWTIGKVTKIEPPAIYVQYPTLNIDVQQLHMSGVVKVSIKREPPLANPYWYCDCEMCSELDGLFDIMKYEVQEQPPEVFGQPSSLFVQASIHPKGLVQSLSEAMPDGPKYVLFLYPTEDPNQAFPFKPTLCERIHCWHSRGFAVVLRSVSTVAEARSYLELFPDRSIRHLIVGGHGSAKQLTWSGDKDGALKKGDRTTDLLKLMVQKTEDGATVLFDACETAGKTGFLGGDNFFTYAAQKLFGREVKGATVKLHDYLWEKADGAECLAADTVVFREDGREVTAQIAAGYPRCKEIMPGEIEAFARAGKFCITQCMSTRQCTRQTKRWKSEHKVYQTNLFFDPTGERAWDRGGCSVGKKYVCKARWKESNSKM